MPATGLVHEKTSMYMFISCIFTNRLWEYLSYKTKILCIAFVTYTSVFLTDASRYAKKGRAWDEFGTTKMNTSGIYTMPNSSRWGCDTSGEWHCCMSHNNA